MNRNVIITPEFLSPEHAAQYCDYSVSYFSEKAKTNNLPTYGVGGKKSRRYKKSDLDKWMQNPEYFRLPETVSQREPINLKEVFNFHDHGS